MVKYLVNSKVQTSYDFSLVRDVWVFWTRQNERLVFDPKNRTKEDLINWQTNCLNCALNSKVQVLGWE